MREFFKFMFASMVGFILAYLVIITIVVFIVIGSVTMIASRKMGNISEKEMALTEKTILRIDLKQPVLEYTEDNPFSKISFLNQDINFPVSLKSIIDKIKRAKNDKNICGIVLNLQVVPESLPTSVEIRNALIDFKKSGKFIYAYSEIYTKQGYYLASVADSIFMEPTGVFLFNGFASEMAFLRGTFDKLDIEPKVIRAGKYKSAGETFTEYKMSKENYEETASLINSLYDNFLLDISKSRKIDTARLREIASEFKIRKASDAVKVKLIDKLCYSDQFNDRLKKLTGMEKPNFINLYEYSDDGSNLTGTAKTSNKIALIYAVGSIGMDDGSGKNIDPHKLSAVIEKARKDKNIKAIVLRINSPGGSALASDIIWREVKLAEKAKTVVISMGNLAASGGYYIACPADYIVAEPTTITGSIGVFGMAFNMEKFWKNKLGITFDRYKTDKYADFGNPDRAMTKDEEDIIRFMIGDIYKDFKKNVAEGRKLNVDSVEIIAQGRVWTGEQALKIHLVDKLGGLYDAVEVARKLAKIDDYRLVVLQENYNPFGKILRMFSFTDVKSYMLQQALGNDYEIYNKAMKAKEMNGVYMLMPYSLNVGD